MLSIKGGREHCIFWMINYYLIGQVGGIDIQLLFLKGYCIIIIYNIAIVPTECQSNGARWGKFSLFLDSSDKAASLFSGSLS
jgi:hypothetical protein